MSQCSLISIYLEIKLKMFQKMSKLQKISKLIRQKEEEKQNTKT